MKYAAIFAHFDPENQFNESCQIIQEELEQFVDHLVIVSTCTNLVIPHLGKNTKYIERPNFGYDFLSYRVGYNKIKENGADYILFLNSSFSVIERNKFRKLILKIKKEIRNNTIVGLTKSKQFSWHIQTFLFAINTNSPQFKDLDNYFSNLNPQNTKWDYIYKYEVGLGEIIQNKKIKQDVILRLNFLDQCKHVFSQLRHVYHLNLGLRKKMKVLIKTFSWANPAIVSWKKIAKQFGILKNEIIRDILVDNNERKTNEDKENFLETKKIFFSSEKSKAKYYKRNNSGISQFVNADIKIPENKIVTLRECTLTNKPSCAVICHLYYIDLLSEILDYLKNIIQPFDLLLTTPWEGDLQEIILKTTDIKINSCTVIITENCGRDILPFISIYKTGLLLNYTKCLKIHSKKSTYSHLGHIWRRQIYYDLLGSSLTTQKSLSLLDRPSIGLVGSKRFFLSDPKFMGASELKLKEILNLFCSRIYKFPDDLGFFAGSMFWFKPEALQIINKIPEDFWKFESENMQQDGTLAHALERAFAYFAQDVGFTCTSTEIEGNDIFKFRNPFNHPPVL